LDFIVERKHLKAKMSQWLHLVGNVPANV